MILIKVGMSKSQENRRTNKLNEFRYSLSIQYGSRSGRDKYEIYRQLLSTEIGVHACPRLVRVRNFLKNPCPRTRVLIFTDPWFSILENISYTFTSLP